MSQTTDICQASDQHIATVTKNDSQSLSSHTFLNGTDIVLKRCELDKCCQFKVHCPFCDLDHFKPSLPARVRDHLNRSHFQHAVYLQGLMVVKCFHQCTHPAGHYHCPLCEKEILKRVAFTNHLISHVQKLGFSSSVVQAPHPKQPDSVQYGGKIIQLCQNKCKESKGKHYHCPVCGRETFKDLPVFIGHIWRCQESRPRQRQVLGSGETLKDLLNPKLVDHITPPSEVPNFKWHKSIVRNLSDLPLSRCQDPSCCDGRYHCPLCPVIKLKPNYIGYMQSHLLSHLRSGVIFKDYYILICYSPCLKSQQECSEANQSGNTGKLMSEISFHFHCPLCGKTCIRKQHFVKHLKLCWSGRSKVHSIAAVTVSGNERTSDDIDDCIDLDTMCMEDDENEYPLDLVRVVADCETSYSRGQDHSYSLDQTCLLSPQEPLIRSSEDKNPTPSSYVGRTANENIVVQNVIVDVDGEEARDETLKSSEQNSEMFSDACVDRLRMESQIYGDQAGSGDDQMIEDVTGATCQPTECATCNNIPTQLLTLQNCVEDNSIYDAGVDNNFHTSSNNCYEETVQISDDKSKVVHRNHAENINDNVSLKTNGLYAECNFVARVEKATLFKVLESDIILDSSTASEPAKIVEPSREVNTLVTSGACVSTKTNGSHPEVTDCGRTNTSTDKIVSSPGSDAEAIPVALSKTDSIFHCQQLSRKRKRLAAKPREEEVDHFPCRKKMLMLPSKERIDDVEPGSTVASSDTLEKNNSSAGAAEKRQTRTLRGKLKKELELAQLSFTSVGNKAPDIRKKSGASIAAINQSERRHYTTRGIRLDFSVLSGCRNSLAMSRDEQNVKVSSVGPMSEKKQVRNMSQNESHLKEKDIVSNFEDRDESTCDKSNRDIVNENCMPVKHSVIKMKPAGIRETNHTAPLEPVLADHADNSTQPCGCDEGEMRRIDTVKATVSEADSEHVSTLNDESVGENFVREVRNICRKISKKMKNTPDKESQNLKLWSSDNLSEELRNLGVNTMFFPKIVTFDDTLKPGKRTGQFSMTIPTKLQVSVSPSTDVCEDSDIEMFEPRSVAEVHADLPEHLEPQTTLEITQLSDQSKQDMETNGLLASKDISDSTPLSGKSTSNRVSQKKPSVVNNSAVGKNAWKCYLCDYSSVHFADFTRHLSAYHGSLPLTCDICEEIFYRTRDLHAHLRLRHGPQPHIKSLTCRHCRKTFAVQSQLDFHVRQSHTFTDDKPRRRARLVCCVCDHVAQSQLEMNVHRMGHKKEDLICKLCGKQFIKLIYLQTHIEAVHTKITSTNCPQCGKFFSHTKYLAHHMKRHTGIKKHVCPICSWRFYERNTLRAHMETHKPRDQRKYAFICSFCGARYCNRTNFKDHLNKHTGNRPHVCHLCGKCFAYRSMLGRHRLYTHSTNKPFMCPTCPKGFRLQSKLAEHLASHAGISSHVCSNCNKGFSTRSSLRQHFKRCKAEDFWLSQSKQSGSRRPLPSVTENFPLDNPSPVMPGEYTIKMGGLVDSGLIGFYPKISHPPEQLSRSQPVSLAMVDPNVLTTSSDVGNIQPLETMLMTARGCMTVSQRHGGLSGIPGDSNVCTTPSVISQETITHPLKWHVSELPMLPHYTSSGHTSVQFMEGPATPSDCATDVSYNPAPKTSETSVLDFMASTDDAAIPVYTKDYYVCSACNTSFDALDLAQAHILTCQASAVTSPESDLSVLEQQGVNTNPGKPDDGFLIEPILSNGIGNIEPQTCQSLLESHPDARKAGSPLNAEQVFIIRDKAAADSIPANAQFISSQAGTRVVQIFEGDTGKFQEYHILSDKSDAEIMELVESLARNKQRDIVQILIPDSEIGHKS